MRHAALRTLLGAAALGCFGPAACADGWAGSLVLTTDYVYRGLSESYGSAAVQADAHFEATNGWFAGAWASSLDSSPVAHGSYELNANVGRAWDISPDWSARVSLTRYFYPDSTLGSQYDYTEILASCGFRDRLFATFGWLPDATQYSSEGYVQNRNAFSYEISARQPLGRSFAVSAGAGYYDLHDLYHDSYWSWSVALSYGWGPFEFYVSHFGADATARRLFGESAADHHWVGTAVWRF